MRELSIENYFLIKNLPDNLSRMIVFKQSKKDDKRSKFYKFLIIYAIAQCTTAVQKKCGV
jgi:hypothetical protein